ncbi:MAG: hypothetical protein R3B90_07080 [Planctomycetaceae bacterium]
MTTSNVSVLPARRLYKLSRSSSSVARVVRQILRSEWSLLKKFPDPPPGGERRRQARHRLRLPVYLQRVSLRGLTVAPIEEPVPLLALTENISESGLGLSHDFPLPDDLLMVLFDVGEVEPLALLLETCWTAVQAPFDHRSGGMILGVCRLKD